MVFTLNKAGQVVRSNWSWITPQVEIDQLVDSNQVTFHHHLILFQTTPQIGAQQPTISNILEIASRSLTRQ